MGKEHHQIDPEAGVGRVVPAIEVNPGLTIAQVVGEYCPSLMGRFIAHEFDQQWQKGQRVSNSLLIMLFLLSETEVVVYDRGYYSYDMLHEHIKRCIHPIFRLKKTECRVVEAFANSDDIDAVVQIIPCQSKHTSLTAQNPQPDYPALALRLVKYEAGGTR